MNEQLTNKVESLKIMLVSRATGHRHVHETHNVHVAVNISRREDRQPDIKVDILCGNMVE
jgi:hypothetical protein